MLHSIIVLLSSLIASALLSASVGFAALQPRFGQTDSALDGHVCSDLDFGHLNLPFNALLDAISQSSN